MENTAHTMFSSVQLKASALTLTSPFQTIKSDQMVQGAEPHTTSSKTGSTKLQFPPIRVPPNPDQLQSVPNARQQSQDEIIAVSAARSSNPRTARLLPPSMTTNVSTQERRTIDPTATINSQDQMRLRYEAKSSTMVIKQQVSVRAQLGQSYSGVIGQHQPTPMQHFHQKSASLSIPVQDQNQALVTRIANRIRQSEQTNIIIEADDIYKQSPERGNSLPNGGTSILQLRQKTNIEGQLERDAFGGKKRRKQLGKNHLKSQQNNQESTAVEAQQEDEQDNTMISSQRKSNHQKYATGKKSATSQHRSKQRGNFYAHQVGSSLADQPQQKQTHPIGGGGPSQNYMNSYTMVVNQNGATSLTPHRQMQKVAGNSNSTMSGKHGKGQTSQSGGNQKRFQSTAPRMFNYRPTVNEMAKSPFLQPIISQKNLKIGVGSGKPQSSQIVANNGKQVILAQNTALKQSYQVGNGGQRQHGGSLIVQQQLQATQLAQASTLPKFLTKKNQKFQLINQQQQQQQQSHHTSINNSSGLDSVYLHQQFQNSKAGSGQSRSPRTHHHQQQFSLDATTNATSNPLKTHTTYMGQATGNADQQQYPRSGQSTMYGGGATKGGSSQIEFVGTMSNGQKASAMNQSSHTPIVNYLMQLSQPNSNQTGYNGGGSLVQPQTKTLHHSQSNQFFVQQSMNGQTNHSKQKPSTSKEDHQMLQFQGNIHLKQQEGGPGGLMVLGQSPSNARLDHQHQKQPQRAEQQQVRNGIKQLITEQKYNHAPNIRTNDTNQMVPFSHQLANLTGNELSRLHNVGKQVLLEGNNASSIGGSSRVQHTIKISHQNNGIPLTNPQFLAASRQLANMQGYGSQIDGAQIMQQHNFNSSGGDVMNGTEDDDAGIDERFDSDGDYGDEMEEFTSPKAAKPRPLDQTFVPQKGKKYFSVVIGYPVMRKALRARGWIEVRCYKKLQHIAGYTSSPGLKLNSNIGLESTMNRQFDNNLDLKFVLSAQEANFQNLKKSCLSNQNRGEGNLTCKSGLKESLQRSYIHTGCWYPMEHCDPLGIGSESFFPRSHVINSSNALNEFQRDFVITEAENYMRQYIRKYQNYKEKGPKQLPVKAARVQTPNLNKRTPSKTRHTVKMKSNANLTSSEDQQLPSKEIISETNNERNLQTPGTEGSNKAPLNMSLQDLGFLKQKLLICCNVVRKRLKPTEDKLDKKKGIRTDRGTAGTILVEERSFLLRHTKNISQAYLKYIEKEDWFTKATSSFPQFKKNKSLPESRQSTDLCERIFETCKTLIEKLRIQHPQTDLNGFDNLWIVKPGGLSRGRKIRLFKDFHKILEYAEVDPQQQLSAANGLPTSSNPSGTNTQYYLNHMKPVGDDQQAYTKKTWVIQKYIENPMLILNRKFDIRVWVVVSTWNPLKIYIFKDCYLRFSCSDYDPRCPQNLFSHLTNNSIGKKQMERPDIAASMKKIPGNMWSLDQFKEYLGGKDIRKKKSQSQKGGKTVGDPPAPDSGHLNKTPQQEKSEKVASVEGRRETPLPDQEEEEADYMALGHEEWEKKWYPQAKEIIVQSILSAWDLIEWRKGGVGVYGFDLFPDIDGKLWLLEINKCPTMEYSTAVTKRLVPRFMEDLVELCVDKRKGDHPVVSGLERVFQMPKLKDLTEFQQGQKELTVEGRGIDSINNQNYLSALHRNKRKANGAGNSQSKGH